MSMKNPSITMHSVLNDYREGNSLGVSLDQFIKINPNHELASTMLKIYATIIDHSLFDKNISQINALNYHNYAIQEQLIFLEYLFSLYSSINRLSNAISILSIIKSLADDSLEPEFQIIPINMEGLLKANQGNKTARIIAFEKCLKILKGKSKRYKVLLWDYLIHLAMNSELDKLEKKLPLLKQEMEESTFKRRYDFVLLLLDSERCNWENLSQHITNVNEDPTLRKFCQTILSDRQKLSNIFLHNDSFDLKLDDPRDYAHISTKFLIKKKTVEALHYARLCAHDNINFTSLSSTAYILLRAELACGNYNNVENFLLNKSKIGNHSVLDDIFYFRLFHGRKQTNEALFHFQKTMELIKNESFRKRIETEFLLSPEISITDIRNYCLLLQNQTSETLKVNSTYKKSIHSVKDEIGFIIGSSPLVEELKAKILKLSTVDLPVLITGETGTGKELIARALYQSSNRNDKKFLAINCGAISDQLLQSELFGHQKGAFTGANRDHKGVFEDAEDGFIFLDEIGEISPTMQVALLRVIENGEFRSVGSTETKKLKCRLIFATNKNLRQLVTEGVFRRDLQNRLDRLHIEVPPLRERLDDLPLLVHHFLNEKYTHLPALNWDKPFIKHLGQLSWPGNIRELRNELERIRVFHSDKQIITVNELSPKYNENSDSKNISQKKSWVSAKTKFRKIDELKNLFYTHKKLNRSETANLLDISLNTAADYLKVLEQENIIEKVQPTNSIKSVFFILKQIEV